MGQESFAEPPGVPPQESLAASYPFYFIITYNCTRLIYRANNNFMVVVHTNLSIVIRALDAIVFLSVIFSTYMYD